MIVKCSAALVTDSASRWAEGRWAPSGSLVTTQEDSVDSAEIYGKWPSSSQNNSPLCCELSWPECSDVNDMFMRDNVVFLNQRAVVELSADTSGQIKLPVEQEDEL
jgi:hypothetical protein